MNTLDNARAVAGTELEVDEWARAGRPRPLSFLRVADPPKVHGEAR